MPIAIGNNTRMDDEEENHSALESFFFYTFQETRDR